MDTALWVQIQIRAWVYAFSMFSYVDRVLVMCQFPIQEILQNNQQFENETEPSSLLNRAVGMGLLKKKAIISTSCCERSIQLAKLKSHICHKEIACDICNCNLWRQYTEILYCVSEIRNRRLQFEALQHLIQLLPVTNRDTLWALLNFLVTVAHNAGDYKDETGNVKLVYYDTCCISCAQYHKMRHTPRLISFVMSICLSATVPKLLEWYTYNIYYRAILI
jgi:hypothetical protein